MDLAWAELVVKWAWDIVEHCANQLVHSAMEEPMVAIKAGYPRRKSLNSALHFTNL